MEVTMKILTLLLFSLHQLGNSLGSSDIEKGAKMVKGICSALICEQIIQDSPFDIFLTKECCLDNQGSPSCCRHLKDWVIGVLVAVGAIILISIISCCFCCCCCGRSRSSPGVIIATQSPPQTAVLINSEEPPAHRIV